jgi:cytochrome c-type biogenesis protein CcmH
VPAIRAQIGQVAQLAGVRYEPPSLAPAPGPSAADMQAAAGMDPEARAEMIRGMVARLSERLATEGGPVGDWARLITAYGVLGETDKARETWQEAQRNFAADDGALDTLRAAARGAGVAQ